MTYMAPVLDIAGAPVPNAEGAVIRARHLGAGAGSYLVLTITGGRILITHLYGDVTGQESGGANTMDLFFDPAGDGAGQALCTAIDVDGDLKERTIYALTGTVTDAMVKTDNNFSNGELSAPLLLSEGTLVARHSGGSGPSVVWTVTYTPIDDEAVVVAATN